MAWRFIAALSPVFAMLGCAAAGARTPAASPDYAVYSTVLDELLADAARTAYLVNPRTHGQEMFPTGDVVTAALGRIPEAPPSLVAGFRERNRADVMLEPSLFRTKKPVQLRGDPALDRAISAQASGEAFPASAPGSGVITLSRVGYSVDGTLAAVHAIFVCGPLCGGGTMVVLERVGRTWIVLEQRRTVRY